jgi:hypothetical protein
MTARPDQDVANAVPVACGWAQQVGNTSRTLLII